MNLIDILEVDGVRFSFVLSLMWSAGDRRRERLARLESVLAANENRNKATPKVEKKKAKVIVKDEVEESLSSDEDTVEDLSEEVEKNLDEYDDDENDQEEEEEVENEEMENGEWTTDEEEVWIPSRKRRSFTKKSTASPMSERQILHTPLPKLDYPPSNSSDVLSQIPPHLAVDLLVQSYFLIFFFLKNLLNSKNSLNSFFIFG
jgi:hypothetical protein